MGVREKERCEEADGPRRAGRVSWANLAQLTPNFLRPLGSDEGTEGAGVPKVTHGCSLTTSMPNDELAAAISAHG